MPRKREIEVKLPVRDIKKLIARLGRIGARRRARVHEENTLFDTEDRQLGAKKAILRIRCEQDADAGIINPGKSGGAGPRKGTPVEGLLTFKGLVEGQTGVRARYKEREEIEYRLKDAERFAGVLRRIGMRPWFKYEKYRTKYRTKDPRLSIDLDETPIGVFLELEGSRRAIDRAARALGYSSRDYITGSYLELYKAECSRKGNKVANMAFPKKKKR
jgi:adenylate cyclase, class 2